MNDYDLPDENPLDDDYEERLLKKETATRDYPTHEEMISLNIRRLQGDLKAREEMIVRNLGLARWFACRLTGGPNSQTYNDVFQEACIGLMRAIDKFDHIKYPDNQLSTIARWEMKARVTRAYYTTGRMIRVDQKKQSEINRVKDIAQRLKVKLNRKPELEEIAKEAGLRVKRVRTLFLTPSATTSSLDAKTISGDGDELFNFVPDTNTMAPDEIVGFFDDSLIIIKQLEELLHYIRNNSKFNDLNSETHLRMFSSRYGIFGRTSGEQTLETVGQEFGVTREYIRLVCDRIFQMRTRLCYPIKNEQELGISLNILRTCIEDIGLESANPRHLWLAGIAPKDNKPEDSRGAENNSTEAILGRLLDLVRQLGVPQKHEKAVVILAASEDFNISEKEACFALNTQITKIQPLTLELEQLRLKYNVEVLSSNPKAIWERQGKLFPAQIPEAERILERLQQNSQKAREAILALENIPDSFKVAICARYGLNGSDGNADDSVFAQTIDIRKSDVKRVLNNLWGNINKRSGNSDIVVSDEGYLLATEEVKYWTLLLTQE